VKLEVVFFIVFKDLKGTLHMNKD